MRKILFLIAFAVGVAATPAHAGYGDDGYGGLLQTLSQYYNSLKQSIAEIATTTGSMTTKLDARCTNLEQGLLNLTRGLQGDIDALEQEAAKWMDYSPTDFVLSSELDSEIESGISRSSSVTKSSDFNSYKSTVETTYAKLTELQEVQQNVQDAIDLAREAVDAIKQKLDKTEAESTYATKETTNNHETRITELENRPGGGCDDNCKNSWANLAGFFDDLAAYFAGENESCGTISFGGTIFDWLNTYNFVCAGEPPEGSEAQQAFDEELNPLFNPASEWLGDGLEFGSGSGEGGLTPIDVKVTESVAGNLGSNLDGTATGANVWPNVAVIDANGHVRKGSIGSVSAAADGTTIESTKEGTEQNKTLKVKTTGIVDGTTLQVTGRKAHVNPGALCDNTTIGTDNNGKLCVKKDAVSYTYPWDFGDGSFKNAYVLYGGRSISASGTNIGNNTDADYYVKVTVSGDTATAVVTTSSTKPSNGWAVFVGHVKNGVLTSGIKTTPAFLVYE